MGQRQALLLATFLTTFGLVLIAALALRLTTDATNVKHVITNASDTEPVAPLDSTTGSTEQALQAVITEREAAYQEALRQANAQIEDAYNQLARVSSAPAAAPVSASAAPGSAALPAAPTFAVTPDRAAQIAMATAPGASINGTPELVDFQGIISYEVNTTVGLIYVDANTGAVVFNSAAQVPVQGSGGGGTAPATQPIPPPTSQISEEQAIAIAISVVGPGTVEQSKLEHEHGILIWDIKFTNDNEVRIDAASGQVVRTEIENDNDNDDNDDRDDEDRDDENRDDDNDDDRDDDDRDDDDRDDDDRDDD